MDIKSLTFFLLTIFLFEKASVAQSSGPSGPQLVSVTPPSPDVQAMQKYGDIPISAYTGIPNISVPIYTMKFRDISVPISLSYHASGIKVAEEASRVGLGWALNAGGTISRNIIGEDDFLSFVYFNGNANNLIDFSGGQGPTHTVQTGCDLQLFNRSIPTNSTIYYEDITAALTSSPVYDFQPDQYYYNFQGHSGKFVMTRAMQAILQKQEAIQISCLNTSGTSWEIKSEDGYIYDFTLFETYSDNSSPSTGTTHMTTWYLTKVTSPLGNTATFNYTSIATTITPVGSYSETRDDYAAGVGFSTNSVELYASVSNGSSKGVTPAKQYNSYLLSSIDLPNCHVSFSFSNNRPDLSGDVRLDSISIFTKNASGNISAAPIKTFNLNYSFFNYGDFDDDDGAGNGERLKLTGMQEIGYYGGGQPVLLPPYVLTYYEGNVNYDLPSKGSFARDHWGYYNGVTGQTSLIPSVEPVTSTDLIATELGVMGPERNTDTNYLKAFSLQSIQYPTGGWTEFQYESNDFDESNSEVNDYSYFASVPDIVPQTTRILYDAVTGDNAIDTINLTGEYFLENGPSMIPTSTGTAIGQTSVNVAFIFSSPGDCSLELSPLGIAYMDIYDATGTVLIQQIDLANYSQCSGTNTTGCFVCTTGVFSINFVMTLLPQKYVVKFYSSINDYGADLENIVVSFTWNQMQTSQPTYYNPSGPFFTYGGGLRIRAIVDHDGVNEANDQVRRYVYNYWQDKLGTGTPQEYSYGRRMSKPEYSYFVIDQDEHSVQTTDGCDAAAIYSFHLTRSSDSNNPLNGSANGAVVGYDQVTELFGLNGENGQKVYKYSNQPDLVSPYPDPFTYFNLPLRPPLASDLPNTLNGSLIEETDYSNVGGSFVTIRDVTDQYTTVPGNENMDYGLQGLQMQTNLIGQCGEAYNTVCSANELIQTYVDLQSEWTHITSTDEKDYDQDNPSAYAEKITNYFYDNPIHLQLTRTTFTNSKGEVITTTTQYPLDFTNVTATDGFTLGVANLQNAHIINEPVEKFIQKTNTIGSNQGAVSGALTFFNAAIPTPSYIYELESPAPVSAFAATTTGASGVSMNAAYEAALSFDQYDAFGNILQQHKANDLLRSYLWDYDNSLPIAEAANASQSDIAQTSFEFDGSGNWNIPSAARDNVSITGSQSYNLSNGNITSTSNLSTANIYIVSYWSNNGSHLVNGSGPTTTGIILGAWAYYEHIVTGTSQVTISGSGDIDELRLYPQGALMNSYTYAPLIGMTSHVGPSGKISYYQYDAFGRLQSIKDQYGNIIKRFDYEYQQP